MSGRQNCPRTPRASDRSSIQASSALDDHDMEGSDSDRGKAGVLSSAPAAVDILRCLLVRLHLPCGRCSGMVDAFGVDAWQVESCSTASWVHEVSCAGNTASPASLLWRPKRESLKLEGSILATRTGPA